MSPTLALLQEKASALGPFYIGASVVSLFCVWALVSHFTNPLRRFPGPFWAKWTNLWRMYQLYKQDYQFTIEKLHQKYGPVVQIGPNTLDLDYPELIKTLYGTDGKYKKTEFYHNSSAIVDGKITYHLFSQTDQAEHARMKRPVVKYYSMSNVLSLEGRVDEVLEDLCGHLEKRFIKGRKDCNLGEWIAFYAWDFISSATFSKRFGYMESAYDHDGTIRIADMVADYLAMVGQMPFLDYLLDKNPIKRIGPPNLQNVTRISFGKMVDRLKQQAAGLLDEKPVEDRDFLDHFVEAKVKNPDVVDEKLILGYLQVNMLAGADTTAITLRALFHFLMTNPDALRRLEDEVLAAGFDRAAVVPYSAARTLPFLDGAVREAMRLHPGVAMLLERYVPEGGLSLPSGGGFVPAGTGVGINPYVMGRNKSVWGADADEFRPERWLRREAEGEAEADYQQRLRRMNAADLTFGGGSRICIGRNVATLEIYKVAATLINRYRILPPEVPSKFVIVSSWFPRQTGLTCRLEKRE